MAVVGAGLTEAKRRARSRLRRARRCVTQSQRRYAEARICSTLIALSSNADRVGVYAAAGSELSVDAYALALSTRGVSVAWPRVQGDELHFRIAPYAALEAGYRGLREPPGCAPLCPTESLDLLIVPGLGFTRSGERLGQGGGFYDRLIAANPTVKTIGVGFSSQVLPALPTGTHDQTVGQIVTEIASTDDSDWSLY